MQRLRHAHTWPSSSVASRLARSSLPVTQDTRKPLEFSGMTGPLLFCAPAAQLPSGSSMHVHARAYSHMHSVTSRNGSLQHVVSSSSNNGNGLLKVHVHDMRRTDGVQCFFFSRSSPPSLRRLGAMTLYNMLQVVCSRDSKSTRTQRLPDRVD